MSDKHITIPYCHINAFGHAPFTGNQAAVMPLESWLNDDILQAIGEENNFAETAFIVPCPDNNAADYALRWFTPAVEIALCGHATLASGAYVLHHNPHMGKVRFATRKAGILTVSRSNNGDGFALSLPAYPPQDMPIPDWVEHLGNMHNIVNFARHQGGYNVIEYAQAADILTLTPDFRRLAKICGDDQFICTAKGGKDSECDVISRVFVPGAGVDEDSVTGSAHAVLTPYWAKKLGTSRFTAHQASKRGGHLRCTYDDGTYDNSANENSATAPPKMPRAILEGQCAIIITGEFYLPS